MRLFGKKKAEAAAAPAAPKATNTHEHITNLKNTEAMLEKKKAHQQTKVDAETRFAKEKLNKKDKQGALQHLKKKKMLEKHMDTLDKQMMNVRVLYETLEAAATTKEVFLQQHGAVQGLKQIQGDLTLDKLDELNDEMQEVMDVQHELDETLSRPIDSRMDFDDDDLMAELDELEQEDMDAQLVSVDLPSVPTGAPKIKNQPAAASEEDAELAKLMADMS